MTALLLLADYFKSLELDDLAVISPDVGPVKLNDKFAEMIGVDLAIMTSERPASQVAEVGYAIGDVGEKTAVILDDISDTAGTLWRPARRFSTRARQACTPRGPIRWSPGRRTRAWRTRRSSGW